MLKIVSGGQTGIDRLALDLAIETGLPHGGWCPSGRRAEDGIIPLRYQLTETNSRNYADRTEKNITHSDATLVLHQGVPTRGTLLTIKLATKHNKPLLNVDFDMGTANLAERITSWISSEAVKVLNVAGPRRSSSPDLPDLISPLLKNVFESFAKS